MLFNSFIFLPFFIAAVTLGFAVPGRFRWIIQLVASYVFYMAWRPEFALLIITSTVVDYAVARMIASTSNGRRRKALLTTSLVVNLGLLTVFKYLGFLTQTSNWLLDAVGLDGSLPQFDILLPVGISFYTFQTIAYTVDVWRGTVEPERHFGKFALFVAFWPQLVAGPIERSARLIPQLHEMPGFDYERVRSGLVRMAWGFFKKVVVADRIAPIVDLAYDTELDWGGGTALTATLLFAVQVYCDFAGYSDIAIGAARVLGVELMENFRTPYFAGSITELWQRWHISLSSWFRDYVYIPLGGSRSGNVMLNLVLTFALSGLWHGAGWNFVAFGVLHGLYLVMEQIFYRGKPARTPLIWWRRKLLATALYVLSGLFFRASSGAQSVRFFARLNEWGDVGAWWGYFHYWELAIPLLATVVLFLVEWRLREREFEDVVLSFAAPARWATYIVMVFTIMWFGSWFNDEFVYFQF